MRRWPISAGLTLGAAAGALTVEALARQVLRVRSSPPYRHDLLGVGTDAVLLGRDAATELPGRYGLAWPEGHAVIGEVLEQNEHTVLRRLERVQRGVPMPGRCALDHIEVGDPRSALGLDFRSVTLDSDAGALPAWWVPGEDGAPWVLLAHGYGGSLVSSLSFLPLIARLGANALVVSYRNDPGAPPSPDRRYHLGIDEWRDLDAGIGFALENGAKRIALFGWSMGGGIALRALAKSNRRDAICALVLDAPVLDWAAIIRHVGRRVPAPVVALVLYRLESLLRAPLSELDHLSPAGELDRPVLCFHGGRDELVPVHHSRLLAVRAAESVTLVVDERAGHVGAYNVDPAAYEQQLHEFLAGVLFED